MPSIFFLWLNFSLWQKTQNGEKGEEIKVSTLVFTKTLIKNWKKRKRKSIQNAYKIIILTIAINGVLLLLGMSAMMSPKKSDYELQSLLGNSPHSWIILGNSNSQESTLNFNLIFGHVP